MEFCLRALGADRANGARARIARRFALVYAAGCLAAEFGILPWTWKEMLQAVKDCYGRVILPPDALTEHTPERSIAAVRDYIERNGHRFIDTGSRRRSLTKEDLQSAGGAVHRRHDGTREFLFTSAQFRGEICDGLPAEQVYGDLKAAVLVHCQEGGKWSVTRDLPEPLGRVRVISVKAAILKWKPPEGAV
jgi:putative DNA primase/helicase